MARVQRALVLPFILVVSSTATPARELTLEQRVDAQRAIERVRFEHRIWPAVNPGAKPAFSKAIPDELLRRNVEDYLSKSRALETLWGRPITREHLQAEIDRMARSSRDPRTLREQLDALGNDPFLIAETLARQTFVDREIRARHASDDRDHGAFDTWWAEQRPRFEPRVEPVTGEFRQPLISAPLCEEDDTWKGWPPASAPPAASSGTAVWTGAEMIVWGGGDNVNTGGRYDPATDTWTPTSVSAGVPGPRFGHTAVWTGSEMIVWGGMTNSTLLASGARYSPVSDSWTPTSATGGPTARVEHTAVWTGTVMVVWGGRNGTPITVTNTGSRYNPSTDTWSATSTSGANVPVARYKHTAVWTGTVMVVWGGQQASSSQVLDSGGRLNVTANTWTTTSTLGVPEARFDHTAVWTGTEMVVWGGSKNLSDQLNSGGRYNPVGNNWNPMSSGANVPAPRDRHTAVWTGTEMIVWGGGDNGPYNSGGRYDPASDSWTATSTGASVPDSRRDHMAVWTGTEMIVWGGCAGTFCNPVYSTGGRYDPSSDTWRPTAYSPVSPPPRSNASTVWTGAEMIIWGGGTPTATNSGDRYDPSTDSWTATSTGANVPPARTQHSAVWTGTEMIVWGGLGSAAGSTGGRYDPATDTWNPTSAPGFQTGRYAHTAVWTGSEMIVWGGGDEFDGTLLWAGARYDPTYDSWVSPTSVGPGGRLGHTAVWTGSEMIVWGGADDFFTLDDGGRYDPQSDGWTPTSMGANVPQARQDHTAVWTGSRMIVWGGVRGGGVETNTGGRYDPVNDTWTPTSTVGAPTARDGHHMVWTGAEMIIWGGGFNLNTGGRYDPLADTWKSTSMDHVPPPGPGSAVYTGAEMIVWSPLARYCACAPFFPDADGDGHGVPQAWVSSCDGTVPAGYAPVADDCDDANAGRHPGALEVCNGIDDDCSGFADDGITPPEAVAGLGVAKSGPSVSVSWAPDVDATSYDVVEGSIQLLQPAGDFQVATTGCVANDLAATSTAWAGDPLPGAGVWIVVRGDNCAGTGSFDEGSASQQGGRDGGIAASPNECP